MQWTVFDLEFTKLLPEIGQEWSDIHISCGSIMSTGDACPSIWYEKNENYLTPATISAFVDFLLFLSLMGHKIVTWGGSSSDWKMLFIECPERADVIKELALGSIDLPMCACMSMGIMMGLNAACRAIGLDLKKDDASENMPKMWETDKNLVLQHVSNDSYATFLILNRALEFGKIPWVTRRGETKIWHDVQFWTVRECLAKDLPSTPYVIIPSQNAKLLARWLIYL